MTSRYDNLFARLDEEDLAELLGRSAVRLVRTLDEEATSTRGLSRLASELYPPSVMLRNKEKRALLLESLPQLDAEALATQICGSAEDPWRRLVERAFRPGSSDERILFQFFDLEIPREDANESSPFRIEIDTQYGLFPHQRLAVKDLVQFLSTGPAHRVMLHMPTGAGKTRTAMHVVATTLRAVEPTLVIWLAFSEELCEQAAEEFERAWGNLGNRPTNVYRFWGGRQLDIEDVRDGFLVMGLQKAFSRSTNDVQFLARLADRGVLVVLDEAHQAVAPTYRHVIERLVDRHEATQLLGLSATPGRTWNDPDKDAELSAIFDRNKVTLRIDGYDNPVDYLIDEGYLARPHFESLEHVGAYLSSKEIEQLNNHLDIPAFLLEHLATDEKRNLLIIDRLEQLAKNHRRIIVFAATVQHAYLLATVLQARDLNASAITGTTDMTERQRIIQRFRAEDDNVRILCNYGVLTTGFDAPVTSAALIARPTSSLVLYSQMVGRAIRGPLAGGNEEAHIVTVVDTNLPGFGQIQDTFTNWEDVWT